MGYPDRRASSAPADPTLPRVSERVEIPIGFKVVGVEVVSLSTAPLVAKTMIPSAVVPKPGLGPIDRTTMNPEFYGRAGFQPQRMADLGYEGFERGANVALLKVSPVRWDATTGRLERVGRVTVRLRAGARRRPPGAPQRIVPEWDTRAGFATASPVSR